MPPCGSRRSTTSPGSHTCGSTLDARGGHFDEAQWRNGLLGTVDAIKSASGATTVVIFGDIPQLPQIGPSCLARHVEDVQRCSASRSVSISANSKVEREVGEATRAAYLDPTPWFCSLTCTAIISRFDVYSNRAHITAPHARYLEGVLAKGIGL
jgi:SGNH domain (fused to AT3 domains)